MINIFKSLRHKNYRLFFFTQFVSVAGTWLQMTAMPWLVYKMTNSAFLLGLIAFLSQIFILLLAPIAGTIADQYDKKKLLMITQILSMLQALIIAALVLTGSVQLWHIIALSIFLSIVNAFDMPIRQSFIVQMVGKEDLMNAIGLNSFIFNSGRVIGPAIAGVLIATTGEGICFLLNGISFIAIIIALYYIKPEFHLNNRENGLQERGIFDRFILGYKYVRGSKQIFPLLVLLSITGMTGMFPMTLMPIIVKDIYKMGPSGLGFLLAAMGIGALLGTAYITLKRNTDNIVKTIYISASAFAVLITLFGLIESTPAAVILLVAIGYFLVLQMALTNTFVQLSVSDEMRGRVMGFFVMAFIGFAPIGSFLAGVFAHQFGAQASMAIGGVISIIAAIVLRKKILMPVMSNG